MKKIRLVWVILLILIFSMSLACDRDKNDEGQKSSSNRRHKRGRKKKHHREVRSEEVAEFLNKTRRGFEEIFAGKKRGGYTKTQEKAEEKMETDMRAEDKADLTDPEDWGYGTGFVEFPIGDEQEAGPLAVAGVYFQPIDMEPPGYSLAKEEADCHMEVDISATAEGAYLGYGRGDFVPWLTVKAYIQKKGSDNVQEIVFMPMNSSDGPHYGANMKFEEGLGTYSIKFEISAPGNEYLLHVDRETGVIERFWTEPIVVEWLDFEWMGPQW